MFQLLSRLAAIILLRDGPQDLPAGHAVLVLCLLMYLVVAYFGFNLGERPENLAMVLALAVTLPMLLCWILLKLAAKLARWEQTVAALFGTSALLSLMSLPLNMAAAGEPTAPLALMMLAVFFWSFAVDAHIWRHALEVSFSTGLALAVLLFAITLFVITTLAGPL
jgi:hypothetical protein